MVQPDLKVVIAHYGCAPRGETAKVRGLVSQLDGETKAAMASRIAYRVLPLEEKLVARASFLKRSRQMEFSAVGSRAPMLF